MGGTEAERLISTQAGSDEGDFERDLRPQTFSEYIGQERVKAQVALFVEAARRRGEALDHVLLDGPPGLGKTTLAAIIAREMGVNLRFTSGPAIERPGDMAAILTGLADRDVLFIDEIHRLSRTVEEILYPAMEDGALDLIIGKGPGARSLRVDLPRFTLVGATTRAGLLTSPLRDRFGVLGHLEYYQTEELERVVRRSARILGVEIEVAAATELACRSRGTPRVANRILRRLRDFAEVRASGVITVAVAAQGLDLLEVDAQGLDRSDRRLLEALVQRHGGGPVGLDTLAGTLGEESQTLEDVYEPYLLQIGFIQRTPRGRTITTLGREHLKTEAARFQ